MSNYETLKYSAVLSNASGVVNFTTTSSVTLGSVGNLHVTGGTSGQVLSTDGSGNLSFVNNDTIHPFVFLGI